MALIEMKSAGEVLHEKKIRKEKETPQSEKMEELTSKLAQHILDEWEDAKSHKISSGIEQRIIDNLRMFRCEYSPDKLAKIKSLRMSETYVPVVNMKCRAGEAATKEIVLQPGEIPWGIEPTPIPTLPPEVDEKIKSQLSQLFSSMMDAQTQLALVGGQMSMDQIQEKMSDFKDSLKVYYRKMVMKKAKEAAKLQTDKMQDQFVEGGFYEALESCIHDLFIFPTTVLKGPSYRKEKRYKRDIDPVTGKYKFGVVDRIIPMYQRVSPFDIYPSPNSTGPNDGSFIERIKLRPKDLHDLIEVNGFNEDEIREVIDEYDSDGLGDWTTISEQSRSELEDKLPGDMNKNMIIALEYWGQVKGELLLEWGLTKEQGVEDKDDFYNICAWLIDKHVIKAMLNPDPLGNKPYSCASWIVIPDSFWGMCVADVLETTQNDINAFSRANVTNGVFSSGPMTEQNIDRIPERGTLVPMKVFYATQDMMSANAPALRFYQPQSVVDRNIMAINHLFKQADDYSGIPSYMHGDMNVGGAGRTLGGIQMLTSNSDRGIKAAISNVDKGLIVPTVERQYYYNIETDSTPDEIPDLRIFAKGTLKLAEKEVEIARLTDILRTITNPYGIQMLGPQVWKELFEKNIKLQGIELESLPDLDPMAMMQQMIPQMTPPNQGGALQTMQQNSPEQYNATVNAGNIGAGGTPEQNIQQGEPA